MEEIKKLAENHFGTSLRIIRDELSIFEQYSVRPAEKKFIPGIWRYRIICKNKIYYFGKSME
jgi:hypothetical protein